LRKSNCAKLLGAWQRAYSRVPAVTRNDAPEARPRYEVHDLREQHLADIHANFFRTGHPKNIAKNR